MKILHLQTAVAIGTILVFLSIVAAAVHGRSDLRLAVQRDAETTLERAAQSAEATINDQLLQADRMLASLPSIVGAASEGGGYASLFVVSRLLEALSFQNRFFRDLMFITPAGNVFASARTSSRNMKLTLPAEAAQQGVGARILGPTKIDSTGDWSIYMVRPVTIPSSGNWMAVAEIPIRTLMGALQPISDIPGLTVTLRQKDGLVVASLPHDETTIGKPMTAADQGSSDSRIVRETLYQGLSVIIALDREQFARERLKDSSASTLLFAVSGGLVLGVGLLIVFGLRRQARLVHERRNAQMLLEDAIAAMPDGFAIWDASDRLVSWNTRFVELSEPIAEPMKQGRTFEQIFGPSAMSVGVQDRVQGSVERRDRQGRWILATERRTATGGRVALLQDITQVRHQSEFIAAQNRNLGTLAETFENSVRRRAAAVGSFARRTSEGTESIAEAAIDALGQARTVSISADETSRSVALVASSAEQLLSAIVEISKRVHNATNQVEVAVARTGSTGEVISSLEQAASRISDVSGLIAAIAAQTNLLALNATIEAARAGEAGRGFAVVANEVKVLAAQTRESSEKITDHVRSIQQWSREAASSLATIREMVQDIRANSDAISTAVETQRQATEEITAHTHRSARNTSNVSDVVRTIARQTATISEAIAGLHNDAHELLVSAGELEMESEEFLGSVRKQSLG